MAKIIIDSWGLVVFPVGEIATGHWPEGYEAT
jgi:hypothetical protein